MTDIDARTGTADSRAAASATAADNGADAAAVQAARRRLLAERLNGGAGRTAASPPVGRRDVTGPVPLSVSQRQLWFHMRVRPDSTTYNELVTVRKDGEFDADAFRRAFNELVQRYDAWRTAFCVIAGEPHQQVQPAPGYDLPLLDLSDLGFEEAEREATRLAVEDTKRPYDLSAGHAIRPRLVRLAPDHHRLYLGLHHLVFDGVTVHRVMFPELVALYDAFAAGKSSPLAEPSLGYVDYSEWEREWVAGPAVAARVRRWRERLAGLPPLDLPLDHPRPRRPQRGGGMVPLVVDRDVANLLRDVGRRSGASLFQVLAAAYAWWLHRYAGVEQVPFATMVDLRQRSELTMLAGYCLSPVVLRSDTSGEPTLVDLVARMRSEVLDAVGDVVPFEHLVRELGVPRDPRRNPLFQATLVLEPPMSPPRPGWSMHLMETAVANGVGQAKFDLGVELDERPEGHLEGRLGYDADLFDVETATRMAAHLGELLARAAASPETPLGDLDQLRGDDRDLVTTTSTVAGSGPVAPTLAGRCVHDVVIARAAEHPDQVAVVVGETSLRYADLVERARGVAGQLVAAGAGPGTVVATWLDRTQDLVVGVLGVLMAGAAYLPVDPRTPAARAQFMVADAGATLLLTREALLDSMPAVGVETVTVDGPAGPASPLPQAAPSDLAYVMYTSGSTGRPKGVMVEHRSVVNLMATLLPRLGVRRGDTVLSVASSSFDMSVGDIFGSLALGARLVLATSEQTADPTQLAGVIERIRPSLLSATPATWSALLDCGWDGADDLVASSGGEALSPSLAQALLDRCAGLWNCYGPTETTDVVSCAPVIAGRPITVGRPLDGVSIDIVDSRDRPVPIGVPGEIVVGGVAVARGYRDRPEETARYFREDPSRPGGRVYRTGDKGRWLADGSLQHLGRYDDQVKIRGFRVEPAEVEAVLREHPQVSAAAVVARQRQDGDHELVAYVVTTTDDKQLRGWLRTRLPEYLVPAAIVALAALPVTEGGKLDRKSLPDPTRTRPSPTGSSATVAGQPELTAVQEQLRALWSRLLEHEVTDIDADFFDLGGHSLLAARLMLELEAGFGVAVPLVDFLESGTTIRGTATLIDGHGGGRSATAPVADAVTPESGDGERGPARPSLFFVYPDGVSVMSVRHFVRAWGTDLEVHALMPEQRYGKLDPSADIEALAAPLLAEILQRQQTGPYFLAGFSLGGLIAYDLTRSLRELGHEVAWLGLIDSGAPSAVPMLPTGERLWVRAKRHLRRTRAERADRYAERTARLVRRVRLAAGLSARPLPSDRRLDYRTALAISGRYHRPGHDQPIELLVTEGSAELVSSEQLCWERLHRGPITVHRFGGSHESLLEEPDVARVAELLHDGVLGARQER